MAKLVASEEEVMLADAARGFLDVAAPVSHLRRLRDEGQTEDKALWKAMADMGWAGILVPENAGVPTWATPPPVFWPQRWARHWRVARSFPQQ